MRCLRAAEGESFRRIHGALGEGVSVSSASSVDKGIGDRGYPQMTQMSQMNAQTGTQLDLSVSSATSVDLLIG